MAEKFAIGEIAILIQPRGTPVESGKQKGIPRNSEVVVLSGLIWAQMKWGGTRGVESMRVYTIEFEGRRYGAPPSWLRKKPPPPKREEVGEWDLCPWKPAKHVTVT